MPDLQSFSFDEFKAMNLSPYQVYGLDIDYQQYYSIQHYLNNKTDVIDKDQILNIVFGDIEVYTANAKVFPKPELAKFPISAITLYNNFNKTFNSYFLLHQFNISKFPNKNQILDLIKRFKKELIENKYIYENENIEIEIFTDELSLIKTCWNKIKDIDPSLLGGWNFDRFDLPYIYFRLGNLLNKNKNEIGKILSRFSKIKVEKFGGDYLIKIPEFPVLDLLYAYKPRDDGGLNMGSKQSSYALDFIADIELGLKKLVYKSEGMTLDQFYETDPINFLLYNIIDVALCVRLNDKLKHVESYNLLRRLMKTSFTASLRGSSIIFDTYVNYKLNEDNQYTRFGLIEENNILISEDEVSLLYIPKSMKKTIKEVSQQTFRSIVGHFSGAYVKESTAQILTSKDGLIVDLDASSLYPSMINQLNISFDTFYGKIIDPNIYNFLAAINKPLAAKIDIPQQFYVNIFEMITKYVDTLKPQNKAEYTQNYYIILAYLLKKISDYKKDLNKLYNPNSIEDYIMLKRFFLPMIDLFDNIHPKTKEYNSFCHEYLINDSLPTEVQNILIIKNILQPSIEIISIKTKDFEEYVKTNNLIISLSGCLFTKHESKKGLFIDFLKNLKNMRNEYEKSRDQYSKGSEEYSYYEMRQKAVKVTMNTTLI